MFRGEINHNVDNKGRMIVPAKFREALSDQFIVTKGLDRCLFVYTMREWEEFEKKIEKLPMADADVRKFVRFFFGSAAELECDAQGRALIPQNLRDFAGIGKEIVSIGVVNRIEIWSKENWEAYNKEDGFIDGELASKMAELGI